MRKLFAILGIIAALVIPRVIFAEEDTSNWTTATGLQATGDASFGPGYTTGENASIAYFIGNYIIKPVFGIVGTIFFALTVYAGVLWMTAAGDPKKVDKAKDILVSSVIGTVIVISAYVITNAVFSGLTEGTIT
jgi:uncharacterized membrane protein